MRRHRVGESDLKARDNGISINNMENNRKRSNSTFERDDIKNYHDNNRRARKKVYQILIILIPVRYLITGWIYQNLEGHTRDTR